MGEKGGGRSEGVGEEGEAGFIGCCESCGVIWVWGHVMRMPGLGGYRGGLGQVPSLVGVVASKAERGRCTCLHGYEARL